VLERLRPDKLLPSTDEIPERFELGTLPYELLAGTTAAVDFLATLAAPAGGSRRQRIVASMSALEAYEDGLRVQVEEGLAELPVQSYSRAARRTPTLLFTMASLSPAEAHEQLAARGVNAPGGSFYAIEPSRRLGLGDVGGLRVGLAPYNDADDVDRLLTALRELLVP
jgi:selenocysteine lyase/cysteine desulfurase